MRIASHNGYLVARADYHVCAARLGAGRVVDSHVFVEKRLEALFQACSGRASVVLR